MNQSNNDNTIYEDKDITNKSEYTFDYNINLISEKIKDGKFNNNGLYIGNYLVHSFTINGITTEHKWRFVAFDWFYDPDDDTKLNKHHIVIMPDECLYYTQMKYIKHNTYGYLQSSIHKNITPFVFISIRDIFKKHIIPYNSLLSTSTEAGKSTGYKLEKCLCNIPSVIQIYNEQDSYYDTYKGNLYDQGDGGQLPLFKLEGKHKISKEDYWLSTPYKYKYFSVASINGYPYHNAVDNRECGVRPLFIFV